MSYYPTEMELEIRTLADAQREAAISGGLVPYGSEFDGMNIYEVFLSFRERLSLSSALKAVEAIQVNRAWAYDNRGEEYYA